MIGCEYTTLVRSVAFKQSQKWKMSYSHVYGYFKSRISVDIARATHGYICGSRVPWTKANCRFPQWEDGAWLGIFLR